MEKEKQFNWIDKELKVKISIEFGSWEDFIIESHNELKFNRLSAISPFNPVIKQKWIEYTDAFQTKLAKLRSCGIDDPRDFVIKVSSDIKETWKRDNLRKELLDLNLSKNEVDDFLESQNIKV